MNSVQINGIGENVVSSSNDQTMIAWRVDGFSFLRPLTNPKIGRIGNADKAIRVVRYRPVDNNLVAAGLENGVIQLWDLLTENQEPKDTFSTNKDDRVLALEFTDDSHYLFSGHGSGSVIKWDIENSLNRRTKKEEQQPLVSKTFDFAVYGLKFIGLNNSHLAIAGRYNRLVIWDTSGDLSKDSSTLQIHQVAYPRPGGKDDYIESLDTAEFNPYRLVTSDNQGLITLWDMENCFKLNSESKSCGQVIDKWRNGHNEEAVRAVALSADGCYLASGGDDGIMKLWPLEANGSRTSQFLRGESKLVAHQIRKISKLLTSKLSRTILSSLVEV